MQRTTNLLSLVSLKPKLNTYAAKHLMIALAALIWCIPLTATSEEKGSLYIPLDTPCRVAFAAVPGGGEVQWLAYGDDLSSQGGAGNPGCVHPRNGQVNPTAIAVNLTAVGKPVAGNGFLTAYPADQNDLPLAASLNFTGGLNVGNSTIIGLCNDGVCDGEFKIYASRGIQVVADVQGYFYPRPTPSREVTVAQSGGDYTSITDALADSDAWCVAPSQFNLCVVNVAPGQFLELGTGIEMKSYISVVGSGISNTTIVLFGADAGSGAFQFDGVAGARLENLTAYANGNGVAAQAKGIVFTTANGVVGNTGITLNGVVAVGFNATGSVVGMSISDENLLGSNISIFNSGAAGGASTGGGFSIGLESAATATGWSFIDSVAVGGNAGLAHGNIGEVTASVHTGTISESEFNGGQFDLFLQNTDFVIRHSHLVNASTDFTNSFITCLFTSGGNAELDTGCEVPGP